MKKIFSILLLIPFVGIAHPGVGIVKDSRGNIFYTDLAQVWKISNGKKSIAVPNVHTHELYIDNDDNLYGEGGYYDDKTGKFYYYMWVHHPNGQTDTVMGMRQAYVLQDFSLARDRQGKEFYIKRFLTDADTTHLFRRIPGEKETIFASGNFKDVNWLHPQNDGSVLYVSNNTIYSVDSTGKIRLVKEQIGNVNPSYKFSGKSITIWGLWQHNDKNIYAAVFSDQTVRKIEPNGRMTDIYRSEGNWTPLHGVFDNDNKLWVLEGSDKNDVRVTMVTATQAPAVKTNRTNPNLLIYVISISIIVAVILVLYFRRRNSVPVLRSEKN